MAFFGIYAAKNEIKAVAGKLFGVSWHKGFTVSLAVIPDGADRHRELRLPQKGRRVRRPDRLPQGLIPPLFPVSELKNYRIR